MGKCCKIYRNGGTAVGGIVRDSSWDSAGPGGTRSRTRVPLTWPASADTDKWRPASLVHRAMTGKSAGQRHSDGRADRHRAVTAARKPLAVTDGDGICWCRAYSRAASFAQRGDLRARRSGGFAQPEGVRGDVDVKLDPEHPRQPRQRGSDGSWSPASSRAIAGCCMSGRRASPVCDRPWSLRYPITRMATACASAVRSCSRRITGYNTLVMRTTRKGGGHRELASTAGVPAVQIALERMNSDRVTPRDLAD